MNTPLLTPKMADVLDRIRRAARPPFHTLGAVEARRAYAAASEVLELPRAALPRVEPLVIDGDDGTPLPARLYAPSHAVSPVLLYLHGGGFTIGGLDTHDSLCRQLALRSGAAVVALDYRLAPEHRFPTAVDDAWAALRWLAAHAGSLGLDGSRLGVAGDSAGGTMAAVCAILARDAGLPLRSQVLITPGTAAAADSPSHRTFANGFLLEREAIAWFFDQYIDAARRSDWRFAPLNAADLEGVAPALLVLAECDPLVDEGVATPTATRRRRARGAGTGARGHARLHQARPRAARSRGVATDDRRPSEGRAGMKAEEFRHRERLRVRWAEIDAQQIVFNGHYLMYVDTAVAGYWRAMALPYAPTMAHFGGDLFVRKAALEYHASARYDELLDVGIRCARIGTSSLLFEAGVFRQGALLVAGELVYVFADPHAQTSKPVPPGLRALFTAFEAGEEMLELRTGSWAELGPLAAPLRQAVFVGEQKVPAELELDAADSGCLHALALNRLGLPLATGRLLVAAPGVAKIGRMAVASASRASGVGRRVLGVLMAAARERGDTQVVLDAQTSAIGFYAGAGFSAVGEPFEEAGIAHIRMQRAL